MILHSSDNQIAFDNPQPGQTRISGTTGGVAFESLTFSDTADFTVDACAHDDDGADNSFTIGSAGLSAEGLGSFTLETGDGSATLELDSPLALPAVFSFAGGAGTNRIIAQADCDDALRH